MTSLTLFLNACYLLSLLRPMLPSVGGVAISCEDYFSKNASPHFFGSYTHWLGAYRTNALYSRHIFVRFNDLEDVFTLIVLSFYCLDLNHLVRVFYSFLPSSEQDIRL